MTIKKINYPQSLAIFLIALIISLPVYSANVWAVSLNIVGNEGNDKITDFVDGKGDVWKVKAQLSDLPAGEGNNAPQNLKIKIGELEEVFDSCTTTSLGATCEYVSEIDQELPSATHFFNVIYKYIDANQDMFEASDNGIINIDGDAPKISNFFVEQLNSGDDLGKIKLDFIVTDDISGNTEFPFSGLKTVKIFDADNNQLLAEFNDEVNGKESFSYAEDAGTNGIFTAVFENADGRKSLQIVAEDLLGHETKSSIKRFNLDLTAPEIKEQLTLTKLNEFIGDDEFTSDFKVDVVEKNFRAEKVLAYSDQADLVGKPATSCTSDTAELNLYHCLWKDVTIYPESSVSITITADDTYANHAEKTITKTFAKDESLPVIEKFGSVRTFNGENYVTRAGPNKIILKAKEDGAGIEKENIAANLESLGGNSNQQPNVCDWTDGTFVCFWDLSSTVSGEVVSIGLSKFTDAVGNKGATSEIDLRVDSIAPEIDSLKILAVSDLGENDYFQSSDRIKIKFVAKESTGITILVNLNGLVMDAATKYPETDLTAGLGGGWQAFTDEENCLIQGEKWECEIITDEIKSGPDDEAVLEFKIRDTAGNDAVDSKDSALFKWSTEKPKNMLSGSKGKYVFNLLASAEEESPDYWELKKVGSLTKFIDLKITELINTRIAFELQFKSTAPNVKLLKAELVGCESDAIVEYGRQTLWNNNYVTGQSSPAKFNLVLEYPPFSVAELLGDDYVAEEVGAETSTGSEPSSNSETISTSGETTIITNNPSGAQTGTGGALSSENVANLEELGINYEEGIWYVDHQCGFLLYTQIGDKAIRTAELQDVTVRVPFALSEMGSKDEGLEQKINDLQNDAFWKIGEVVGTLYKILKIANYIARGAQMVITFMNLWQQGGQIYESIATKVETATSESPYTLAIAEASAVERMAFCMGDKAGQTGAAKGLDWLQVPLQVLTCKKGACGSFIPQLKSSWYNQWVCSFTQTWNAQTKGYTKGMEGGNPSGVGQFMKGFGAPPEATSLYDNIYLSVASLCLPGIINNLNKLRQIRCRHIYCLKTEVPQKIATVDSCEQLSYVLVCKYFLGGLFALLPTAILDNFMKTLASKIKSPTALISGTVTLVCSVTCLSTSIGNPTVKLSNTCVKLYWVLDVASFIDEIIGLFMQIKSDLQSGGADFCDQINQEKNGETKGKWLDNFGGIGDIIGKVTGGGKSE